MNTEISMASSSGLGVEPESLESGWLPIIVDSKEYKKRDKEFNDLKAQVEELSEQKTRQETNFEAVQTLARKAFENIDSLSTECQDLRTICLELQKGKGITEHAVVLLRESNTLLRGRLELQEEEYLAMQELCIETQEDIAKAKEKMAQLKDRQKVLVLKSLETEDKLRLAAGEKQFLREKIEMLQQARRREIEALEAQNRLITQEKNQLARQGNQLKLANGQLTQKYQQEVHDRKQLARAHTQAVAEQRRLEQKVKGLVEANKLLQREKNRSKQENERLSATNNQLEQTKNQLTQTNSRLTAERDRLRQEKGQLTLEKNQAEQDKDRAVEERAQAIDEKIQAIQAQVQAEQAQAQLVAERDQLVEAKAELDQVNQALVVETAQLKEDIARLTRIKDFLLKKHNDLVDRTNETIDKHNRLAKENAEFKKQKTAIEQQINELVQTLQDVTQVSAQQSKALKLVEQCVLQLSKVNLQNKQEVMGLITKLLNSLNMSAAVRKEILGKVEAKMQSIEHSNAFNDSLKGYALLSTFINIVLIATKAVK